MVLADPTLAPAATRGVVWKIAMVATALCDPGIPETGDYHAHKHGELAKRAHQLLAGPQVTQLALLQAEGELVHLLTDTGKLIVQLPFRPTPEPPLALRAPPLPLLAGPRKR